MTSLPGGWIADRLIGQRRAVLYGGILIACGHFSMAFPSLATFYLGLRLIVIGTGLLKGNVSVIVGRLYRQDDSGATPGSRSSTWGSTSARSSRRWSADTWGSASAGISASPRPASAWCSASCSTCSGATYLGDAGLLPTPPESQARCRTAQVTRDDLGRRHRSAVRSRPRGCASTPASFR